MTLNQYNNQQDLKKNLMYRIYIVYMTRKLLNARGLSLSGLVICLGSLFWLVSIFSVLRNFWAASSDFGSAYGFVAGTFTHTSIVVQTISIGLVAVGVFLAVDLYRNYLYTR